MIMKIGFVTFYLFSLLICGCTNQEEIIFTGYSSMAPPNSIYFDTLNVSPTLISKEYYGSNLDTNYYWEVFEVSRSKAIILKCSSQSAVAAGNFADSLFIRGQKFSITKLFNGQPIRYRILRILEFKFQSIDYLALIGRDKNEGGNRILNDKVLLVEINNESIDVFCPPLNLDFGLSNAQSYLSDYFCNLNQDDRLDFLQWNQDSIHVYSLFQKGFIRQNEFIKLFQKTKYDDTFYIDKLNSNWPYPLVKTLKKFPDPPNLKFNPSYY